MSIITTLLRRLILELLGRVVRLLPTSRPANPPRRILVIKPDHIGDVLLLLPALQLLRAEHPHAHITVLVGPWSAQILYNHPLIDTLQLCPFPGFTRQPKSSRWQPYLLLLRTALLLRDQPYDAALIARDDHWWGALLAALARIPHRIGYAVPTVAPFLTTALPHDSTAHVAAQSLALSCQLSVASRRAASAGGDQQSAAAANTTNADDLQSSAPISPTSFTPLAYPFSPFPLPSSPFHFPLSTFHSLVALQPGAGGAGKLWLSERWIAVGRALEEQGYRIIVTGGPSEVALVSEIAAGLRDPLTLTNAPTLQHLGAVFAKCRLVLGVDSGPLHLAVAVGVPTIALFGPGDPQRFGPWGDPKRHHVIRSGLWCSPCGVLDHCPRGTVPAECMTLIPVRTVLAACARMLNRSA